VGIYVNGPSFGYKSGYVLKRMFGKLNTKYAPSISRCFYLGTYTS